MAMGDYKRCDLCGNKAFYDADIQDPRYVGTYSPEDIDPLYGVVDLKVLCPKCAKTHEVIIKPKKIVA